MAVGKAAQQVGYGIEGGAEAAKGAIHEHAARLR
jgi:hypothetical protein